MAETFIGFLASLVFLGLYLPTRDEFDLLPRRVTRAVSTVCAAVLAFTCYFVPSAFQAGVTRAVDKISAEINQRLTDALKPVLRTPTPTPPTPTPTPTPTPPATRRP